MLFRRALLRETETDLLAAHRYAHTGDVRAFEVLVRMYGGMVYATCLRQLGNAADADDAAQETFLKLSRQAGGVRANLGAWLHACAVGTSRDAVRASKTRRRIEQNSPLVSPPVQDDRPWSELRSVLDEALAKLDESDRELIITRFLLGASQKDMADAARVHPGTMHRRIDAALDRLRKRLHESGFALAAAGGAGGVGGAGLGAAIGAAGSEATPPMLTSSLMKVGLVGMVGGAKGSVAAPVWAYILAGVVASAGVIGIGWSYWGHGAITGPDEKAAVVFELPAKPTAPVPLVSITGDFQPGRSVVKSDGRTISFEIQPEPSKPLSSAKIVLISRDEKAKPAALKGTFENIDLPMDHILADGFGMPITATYTIVGKRLDFTPIFPGERAKSFPPEANRWRGRRDDTATPTAATDPIAPDFVGRWKEMLPWNLSISKEFLTITTGETVSGKFRVLETEKRGDVLGIQTICTANINDMALIGQRIKMLIRKDDRGYTLVYNSPLRPGETTLNPRLNEWPESISPKAEDKAVRCLIFAKEEGEP